MHQQRTDGTHAMAAGLQGRRASFQEPKVDQIQVVSVRMRTRNEVHDSTSPARADGGTVACMTRATIEVHHFFFRYFSFLGA